MIGRPATAQTLNLTRPRLQIGALDGDESEVFGHIAGVGVDNSGNIFVLDDLSHAVRAYRADGKYLGSVGGNGGGPGELRAPTAIALDKNGTIYVLDPPNGRISVYSNRSGRLQHLRDLKTQAYDFCILGTRIFILFPTGAGIIHEVDAQGAMLRSFGKKETPEPKTTPRGVPSSFSTMQSNRGHVLCDEDRQSVVVLFERLPILRSFSANGREQWRTQLRNYHSVHWQMAGKRIQMGPDPATGTAHTGVAITIWNSRYVVTLHEGSLKNLEGRLEARVIDRSLGKELNHQRIPVRIAAIRGAAVYGQLDQPFPHVVVY